VGHMEITGLSDRATAVTVADDRWRTTAVCLAVDLGARHDPKDAGGCAHLLEHVLMSAPTPEGPSVSEHIERLGGSSNATTGIDSLVFQAHVLTEDAPATVRRLVAAVTDPLWTQDCLDAERHAVRQELAAAQADPSDVVQDAFLADVFPGHPLGRPVGGVMAELDPLRPADLAAFHRDGLLPRRMALVAVGSMDHEALVDAARPPRGDRAIAEAEVPLQGSTPLREIAWPGDEFCWISVGGRAPSMNDPRRHAFDVLAKLLGSSPASLLYQRLRVEQGKAYAFYSWARNYLEAGVWRVMVGSETRNGPAVVDTIRRLLEEIAARGPDATALDAARRQQAVAQIMDLESPLDQALRIARETCRGGGTWSLDADLVAIGDVTADQVRSAATDLLDGLVVTVRPEGADRD
jgi:predicted Zn-dependent peptidase